MGQSQPQSRQCHLDCGWLVVVVLVGSILSSVMLYQKNRQVAEAQSRAHQALLESLATSDPAFVAGVLDQIELQIPDRIPSLSKLLNESRIHRAS